MSGYSQIIDKQTAHTEDEYLYSVKFSRSSFYKINFDNIELIDTIKAFENFEYVRNMYETGILKKKNHLIIIKIKDKNMKKYFSF